ncbi:MAG: hypothetical protein IBX55_02010 [Methyloprofundus sp.]|nr:hypothetical protein [Methyloprofundus sp.]
MSALQGLIDRIYGVKDDVESYVYEVAPSLTNDERSELAWYCIYHNDKFYARDVLEFLIKQGVNPGFRKDGYNLLFWASLLVSDWTVRLLVERAGVNPNEGCNLRGSLPIHVACEGSRHRKVNTALYLLSVTESGLLNTFSFDGRAPVHQVVACDRRDLKLFDELVSRGVDVGLRTSDGHSLPELAAIYCTDTLYLEKTLNLFKERSLPIDFERLRKLVSECKKSEIGRTDEEIVSERLAFLDEFKESLVSAK